MSTGAVVAIILAVLLVAIALGVGSLFAMRSFLASQSGSSVVPNAATHPEPPPPAATDTTAPLKDLGAAPGTGSATSSGSSTASDADPGLVTDAEARTIVRRFLDFRVAHNIAASKTLCTKNMLTGENGSFVNDKYWRPDSYKITKTTPDQMYIHVTTMGMWPSGEEPTIYSVWRDPANGKVLIDGMLDPANNPDLVK